jgi:hypothetical protein
VAQNLYQRRAGVVAVPVTVAALNLEQQAIQGAIRPQKETPVAPIKGPTLIPQAAEVVPVVQEVADPDHKTEQVVLGLHRLLLVPVLPMQVVVVVAEVLITHLHEDLAEQAVVVQVDRAQQWQALTEQIIPVAAEAAVLILTAQAVMLVTAAVADLAL